MLIFTIKYRQGHLLNDRPWLCFVNFLTLYSSSGCLGDVFGLILSYGYFFNKSLLNTQKMGV